MKGGREFVVSDELRSVHEIAIESTKSAHDQILAAQPGLELLFREFLESIDIQLIQRLIHKQLLRAGVLKENTNQVQLTDVFLSADVGGTASHSFVTNQIKIDVNTFQKYCSTNMTPQERERAFVRFAHVLIHEIVHSMSWIRGQFGTEERGEKIYVHDDGTSGFHTNNGNTLAQYEGWNEAITERIADEIILVYARCKGISSSYVINHILRENSPKNESRDRYVTYRLMMQIMIEKIAEYSGTTPETVWRGVKERYFSGGAFNDSAIQALFKETFGEKCITDLSKVKNTMNKRQLKRFLNKYNLRIDTRTANRWFRELGLNYYLIPRNMR